MWVPFFESMNEKWWSLSTIIHIADIHDVRNTRLQLQSTDEIESDLIGFCSAFEVDRLLIFIRVNEKDSEGQFIAFTMPF